MPIQLITAAELRACKVLSASVPDNRLDMFINEAQMLDIRPFMGDAFYYDMIINLTEYYAQPEPRTATPMQQLYLNLVDGTTYTDINDHQIIFEGMKVTHELFAFARFVSWDSYRYTATGAVVKQHEQSVGLSEKAIARNVEQARSEANAHANEVQKYLFNLQTDYPLWFFNQRNKQQRQPGPRITGIDRNNYNYPGQYSTLLNPYWFLEGYYGG